MKIALILLSFIATTSFAQSNLSPSQKKGACYAACTTQSPKASCSQNNQANFDKYNQQFQKYKPNCVKPNATIAEVKSCMIASGLSNDGADFMFAYNNTVNLILNKNMANYDISVLAVTMCN